jgi:hypothetical protein
MSEQKIYTLKELEELFPFGKTKLLSLCRAGVLPVVKVGRDYISTPELIERWMRDNEGKEILY